MGSSSPCVKPTTSTSRADTPHAMAIITPTDTGYALAGELTVDTVSGVYGQTPAFSGSRCELDLSGVTGTDSSGLALLLYWMQQAAARGCVLSPHGAPRQMRSLLRVSGLEGLLQDAGFEL